MNSNNRKALIFAVAAIIMWSTVASAFKIALKYQTPYQLLFYASLCSTITLGLLLFFQGQFNQLFRMSFVDVSKSIGLGFLNPFIYYLILFQAYNRLPAQEAQVLNFTWPLFLALLAVPVLGQSFDLRSLFAFLISPIGVLVIATRGDVLSLRFDEPVGVSLALGSGIFWGLFWTFNVKDKRPPLVKLFMNFFFGLLFIAILGLVTKNIAFPGWIGFAGAVYAGLFEMSLTFFFWLKALTHTRSASSISNLAYMIPFISLLVIQLVTGETIQLYSIIGLVFILSGILIENYSNLVSWAKTIRVQKISIFN